MSDATAAASTSAPAAAGAEKKVKLTSADNEEFNVDQEVVRGPALDTRYVVYVC